MQLLLKGDGEQSSKWHVHQENAAGFVRIYYIKSGEVKYCDDYEEYYSNATRYTLVNSTDGTELITQDEPITLDKILNLLGNDKGKISRGAMKSALKNWQITTSDNSGVTILYPVNLIDALQGFVEYGDDKIPCYLFNGNWFVFWFFARCGKAGSTNGSLACIIYDFRICI